jgi:capsular polysaccharide biosynthesis protein
VEIGQYLDIVRRRWWLVALTFLAALFMAGVFAVRGATAYKATVRVAVSTAVPDDYLPRSTTGPDGMPRPGPFYDPNYYNWLTSEYLADDLSEIVRSRSFAEDVSAIMGENVDPKSISDVVRTRKTHRILSITVTANEFGKAQRLGDAIVKALQTESPKYLRQLSAVNGQIVVIDPPETQRGEGAAAVVIDIGLKALLGLLFGLALVFALDYLDPRVRNGRDAERTLGLPIMGEIPDERLRPARARGAAAVGG